MYLIDVLKCDIFVISGNVCEVHAATLVDSFVSNFMLFHRKSSALFIVDRDDDESCVQSARREE